MDQTKFEFTVTKSGDRYRPEFKMLNNVTPLYYARRGKLDFLLSSFVEEAEISEDDIELLLTVVNRSIALNEIKEWEEKYIDKALMQRDELWSTARVPFMRGIWAKLAIVNDKSQPLLNCRACLILGVDEFGIAIPFENMEALYKANQDLEAKGTINIPCAAEINGFSTYNIGNKHVLRIHQTSKALGYGFHALHMTSVTVDGLRTFWRSLSMAIITFYMYEAAINKAENEISNHVQVIMRRDCKHCPDEICHFPAPYNTKESIEINLKEHTCFNDKDEILRIIQSCLNKFYIAKRPIFSSIKMKHLETAVRNLCIAKMKTAATNDLMCEGVFMRDR